MSDEAGTIAIGNPELGWVVIGMRTHVALIPTHEDDHVLGVECWCEPKREDVPGGDGPPLITHRDLGEREGLGELTAGRGDG